MDVNKKKVVKIILMVVLLILMLLLWWKFWGGKSFSKYKGNVNGSSITEVAKPIFVTEGADDIKIDGIEDTVYNFSVKNFKGNETSEVDLKYFINIENNSDADLEFILSKNGENVVLTNNKTRDFTLANDAKHCDDYTLSIKYHNNPAITEDITGNIQIKVEAVQIEK